MSDPLDDKIKKRIKEVFDNYEDARADEGWLLLREKFPAGQSKRRGAARLWWGAAAAVLLFTGIGLWMGNKPFETTILASKTDTIKRLLSGNLATAKPDSVQHLVKNKSTSPAGIANKIAAPINNTDVTGAAPGSNTNHSAFVKHGRNRTTPNNPVDGVVNKDTISGRSLIAKNNSGITKPGAAIVVATQPLTANNQVSNKKAPASNVMAPIGTDKATQANTLTAATPPVGSTKTPQPSLVNNIPVKPLDKKQQNNINAMFARDKGQEKLQPLSTDKKVRFGVYAATYFNYAKGSSNQVNLGAGVSSDIRLGKNLKLVTGVSIAQNTLNFSSESAIPVAAAQQNFAASAAVTSASTLTLAAKPQLEAGPTFKNYNANLVGLDVPLNLKYEFSPDKSDAYVSAGVSSGTFINEAYTYNYNYPTMNASTQTDAQTDHKSFNNFYFAKTLNFSFGVGYPVGKNNTLVVEPFLKYPLDGLGAQQIRFGAGGINLKLNFKAFKK